MENNQTSDTQLWVEPIGDIIIARLRGTPNVALLKEAQERILSLVAETNKRKVLYDALEMETLPIEVPLSQWKLDKEAGEVRLKRAVVVPNTKLAYLARLAFAEEDCRIFYNDLTAAVGWLKDS